MDSGPLDPGGWPQVAALRAGVVVGGKLVLIRPLGQGAVGAVFEAEDTWLGRRVAVKLLHPHVARHPDVMWRFRREARAAASIDHPNIVDVLEVGQRKDGTYYIVQELLDGVSLRQHLVRRGRLPADEALEILVPIMGALVASHRKDVIHRDIKPENILLARDATGGVHPKLIDFGIARMTAQQGELDTATGVLLGTPSYMSPEQAAGAEVDAGADVWAIGAVMYELLAGTRPFTARSAALVLEKIRTEEPAPLAGLADGVPDALAEIVHHALAKDPLARFPSMQAMLRAALDHAGAVDPTFSARHARSIPPHVGALLSGLTGQGASMLPSAPPSSTPFAAMPMARPDVEWNEDAEAPRPRGLDAHAESALRVNALDDAVALADRALEEHATRAAGGTSADDDDLVGRMRLVQAIANRWLGRFAEAASCAREASVVLARGTPPWYAAMGHLAMAEGYLGNNVALADLAEELADMEPGPRAKGAHVRALAQGVVLLVRGGLVALAERLFASARRIVTDVPFGEPTVRAWVDQAGAEMALHAGDPTTFLALIESAIEGFAEAGDTRNAALQRAGVGAAYLQLGAFARAERVLRQAIAIAEPMRLAFVAPARASLGATLARLGHLDEALAIEADAVERCVAQGYRRVEAIARVHLADVHVRRGALAEADAELRRAEAAASGLPAVRAHALAAHAECALAGDARADRALAYATEAMEILAARGGVDEAEARIRLAHVRALEASGRTQEAGVALAAAAARLRERAARIGDPRYRRAFLHDVPENAATLARGGVVDPPGSGLV